MICKSCGAQMECVIGNFWKCVCEDDVEKAIAQITAEVRKAVDSVLADRGIYGPGRFVTIHGAVRL